MIKVTVVLHEIDGHQVEVSQKTILSEDFALRCGQWALQTYNTGSQHFAGNDAHPILASDAKVYNSEGTLIVNVKR